MFAPVSLLEQLKNLQEYLFLNNLFPTIQLNRKTLFFRFLYLNLKIRFNKLICMQLELTEDMKYNRKKQT